MLQSILKLTLFNDDEEVRPKNHPKKKIPDARRKNRDGGKTIGAADGEQPRLQIENNRNLLKLSVSEANLETKKGKRNTHTHTGAATETIREKTEHEIKSYLHEKAQISSFRDKIQELLEQCSRAKESSSISRPSKRIQCHEL
jgi:hypothetical protein